MKKIKLLDKEFVISIPYNKISKAVKSIADQMKIDLSSKDVVFLGILNGSFMFAAELFRHLEINCQISFVKVASYAGTTSTGVVKTLIGINEDIAGKTVVILEDIVDTGNTITQVVAYLKEQKVHDIKIATLLIKPDAYKGEFKVDYSGIEIPNDFIVGFGLDYNGYGRNLTDIYTVI